MKPVKDRTLDELEDTAIVAAKAIREFLKYKGNDRRYFDQARVASGAISAFAKTRASESNRMAVELAAERWRQITEVEHKRLAAVAARKQIA